MFPLPFCSPLPGPAAPQDPGAGTPGARPGRRSDPKGTPNTHRCKERHGPPKLILLLSKPGWRGWADTHSCLWSLFQWARRVCQRPPLLRGVGGAQLHPEPLSKSGPRPSPPLPSTGGNRWTESSPRLPPRQMASAGTRSPGHFHRVLLPCSACSLAWRPWVFMAQLSWRRVHPRVPAGPCCCCQRGGGLEGGEGLPCLGNTSGGGVSVATLASSPLGCSFKSSHEVPYNVFLSFRFSL